MSDIAFYDTGSWRSVRRTVLAYDNNECQYCKERGRHRKAVIVHHIYHLEDYPEYGLMMWVEDPVTGERRRNLISVCRECHETVCHPERMREITPKEQLTVERW